MSQAQIVVRLGSQVENQAVLKNKKSASPPTPEQLATAAKIDAVLGRPGAPSPGSIATACGGITEQAVSNWRRTGKIGKKNLAILSKMVGLPVTYFLFDEPLELGDSPSKAQSLSPSTVETVSLLTMEKVKVEHGTLPKEFKLLVETSEMEPIIKRGARAYFSSAEAGTAGPGDVVLARDSLGGVHLRLYKAGRPGMWEGHAQNSAFEPLHSDRDGLTVLAVLTSVEGRWGGW